MAALHCASNTFCCSKISNSCSRSNMLIQVAGVWKTIICFSWQVKHVKVFYRNSSVLGFQWDESEVIKGLPVWRRVPEVFEMAVYEKRDIYTGVFKFRWVVLEFANVHLQSAQFPLPSVNFMFGDTINLWINKTFLMGRGTKSLLYWSLKFVQAPTKATLIISLSMGWDKDQERSLTDFHHRQNRLSVLQTKSEKK